MKKYFVIWGLLLVAAIGMVFVAEQLSPEMTTKVMKEGGWIETASWVAYFVAGFFLLIQTLRKPSRWSMLVLTLCLGMRELDFDKRFTTMGIFKSRFYFSAEVPVLEKLIGVVVTALLVTSLFFLVKTHLVPFFKKIKAGEGPSLSFLFSGGLLVFAKSIDGFSRKLEPLGIVPSDAMNHAMESIEEVFELAAALLIVVAAVGALRYRSK